MICVNNQNVCGILGAYIYSDRNAYVLAHIHSGWLFHSSIPKNYSAIRCTNLDLLNCWLIACVISSWINQYCEHSLRPHIFTSVIEFAYGFCSLFNSNLVGTARCLGMFAFKWYPSFLVDSTYLFELKIGLFVVHNLGSPRWHSKCLQNIFISYYVQSKQMPRDIICLFFCNSHFFLLIIMMRTHNVCVYSTCKLKCFNFRCNFVILVENQIKKNYAN